MTIPKKIGMVQPNFQAGPRELNAYFLPYSLGLLWTYAAQDEVIRDNFEIIDWVFSRNNFSHKVEKLSKCDIVFFSLYVWNRNWCLNLATQIKKANPNVLCVFGGPEVPYTDPAFNLKYPQIDVYVKGEGEHVFYDLLKAYFANEKIPSVITGSRVKDLEIPSPYLEGTFDKLIADNPDVEWMPTLETDRGCPYQCTFCDWGQLTASKVYKFKLERFSAELDWCVKNKLPFMTLTTANFGIFADRDLFITEMICNAADSTGYPNAISVSYGKNNNRRTFDIIKRFNSSGIQANYVLSLQTTNTKSLKAIKRTNMKVNDIAEITDLANELQFTIWSELILGLPEETLYSWKKTITDLFGYGLHNGADAVLLNFIENAPMVLHDMEKYDMQFFEAKNMFYQIDHIEHDEYEETVNVVQSTSTMTKDDIIDALMYTWFTQGLHCSGITELISRFLNKNKSISYYDFYNNLEQHLAEDPFYQKHYEKFRAAITEYVNTGYFKEYIGEKPMSAWQMTWSLFILMDFDSQRDYFVDKISQHVAECYDIDKDIIADYKQFVKHRVKSYHNYFRSPIQFSVNTNFWEYINDDDTEIDKRSGKYEATDRTQEFPDNFDSFVDSVFFKRRRGWFHNVIRKINDLQVDKSA